MCHILPIYLSKLYIFTKKGEYNFALGLKERKQKYRGMFEFNSPETRQVQERLVSILEHLQVPKLTGPGVRRSKRPLLTCRTRCKRSMETSRI